MDGYQPPFTVVKTSDLVTSGKEVKKIGDVEIAENYMTSTKESEPEEEDEWIKEIKAEVQEES